MADMIKGCRVRVSNPRARKLKYGTTGVAVWIGQRLAWSQPRYGAHRYETIVGVKVDGSDGKPVYVNKDNLEVIGASPDEGLPELYGTERQVSWAMKLRRDALEAGRFTLAEISAPGMQSAKYWIESRPGANSPPPAPRRPSPLAVPSPGLKIEAAPVDDNDGEAYADEPDSRLDEEPCDDPREIALSAMAEKEAADGESKAQQVAAEWADEDRAVKAAEQDFSDLGF